MINKIENPEMDAIGEMLNYSVLPSFDYFGQQDGVIDLSPECIWSAMNYLKKNPNSTIEDACEFALQEWIK